LIVVTTVHINHWTRGKPLTLQLSAAAVLFAVGYAVVVARSGMDGLLGCMLFLTLGEMMLFTNANSYLQKMVPEHKLGRALALNSITFSVALSLSTPTVGYFFTSRSPRELWVCLSGAGLLAAWGFYRLPRPDSNG
jgi:MFS family permease